jgi:hypothetical protein
MKRNSTTLFLPSPGATTPIPWMDNAPDFSGFTEPTLSVLVKAWDDFVASGGELEIIPDPVPVVEQVAPNYPGFNLYMLTNAANAAYKVAVNQVNPDLVAAVALAYNNIVDRGIGDFVQIFPVFCVAAQVTTQHREEWAAAAESFNLPQDFVEVIRG